MKSANIVTLALIIIGGLNWGLVGLLNWDLVAAIFGSASVLSRAVYVLVGLSALWQMGALATGSMPGAAVSRSESSTR